MFKVVFILISLYVTATLASQDLITQGDVTVTFDDIDGFAYTMPQNIRSGFFDDIQLIDDSVTKILTMKLVNKYAQEQNVLNLTEITSKVESEMLRVISFDSSGNNYLKQEKEYQLIKEYLLIKEKYNYFQKYFNDLTHEEDLYDLSEEYYILNQDSYIQPETRDLTYLSISYNEYNKQEQYKVANKFLEDVQMNKTKFHDLVKKHKESASEFLAAEIKNYQFNKKQLEFSKIVFEKQSIGLINKIIDLDSKYLLISINNVTLERQKLFMEVRDEIVKKNKKEKNLRDFNNLILKLTKQKVALNKENLNELRVRYLKSI